MSDIAAKSWNLTAVRRLVSSRVDQRPLPFLVDDQKIEIRTILESWPKPGYLYLMVETEDGKVYKPPRHEYEDSWELRLVEINPINE